LPGGAFWTVHPSHYPLWRLKPDAPDRWLVLGGRGAGKTFAGSHFVLGLVNGFSPYAAERYGRIALVGETLADVREVMIEGPSGIRALSPKDGMPAYEATRRRLVWENGAVAQMFSSEDPDSLRGPQFDAAWGDELAKWKNQIACFDMLQFGLRLGKRPQQMFTTTPRPQKLLRDMLADEGVHVSRMRTEDNADNLAGPFLASVRHRYGKSRLGRQELDGELIEDRDDALWKREKIEALTMRPDGGAGRIVVAVDPPATSSARSDACGIVAVGRLADGRGVVLADETVRGAGPTQWARRAVALYHRLDADCIVAETNQGGEMVAAVLHQVDDKIPVRSVRASRGKWLRAEPVAALYEQDRVIHAARFAELEDEMCDFGRDGLSDGRSPDRVDALVWALTELMLAGRGEPRVRAI
jgi:phage terminase large subunit-like protein